MQPSNVVPFRRRLRVITTPLNAQLHEVAERTKWIVAGCTCDQRFFDVAFDIDCPLHGLIPERQSGAAA